MEKGGRAEEIVGMRECVLGRAGASQLGAERERGGEGEGEREGAKYQRLCKIRLER